MRLARNDLLVAVALAALVFGIHVFSPVAQPYDSVWTIHTTESLLRHGDANLNEYISALEAAEFYHIECVFPDGSRIRRLHQASDCQGGSLYHFYPLGVPLMTLPAVAVMKGILGMLQPGLGDWAASTPRSEFQRRFLRGDLTGATGITQLVIASLLIAASTALFYLLVREWLGWKGAVVLALLFAFGSPAWSTGSRALWMHGYSMFLLTAAFLLVRRAAPGPRWPIVLAGALLMFSFFVRPTNVIALVAVAVWTLWRGRRDAFSFLMGCAPVCLAFAAIHLQIYHSLLPAYSQVRRADEAGLAFGAHVPVALVGNLVSPSRGLFVFTPAVLFALAGLWLWWRDRRERPWAILLASIFGGHYLLISFYEHWFGGHGYGPRYFADLAPLLILPIAAFLVERPGKALGTVFAMACAISVFMHSQGAWCWPCQEWDHKPREIGETQWRLWDWGDPMFLRGFQPERALAEPPSPEPAPAGHSQ
jgi:hypothetical protein